MKKSQEGRALRQFTLSTGKSAGRNSSGRITRGGRVINGSVPILMGVRFLFYFAAATLSLILPPFLSPGLFSVIYCGILFISIYIDMKCSLYDRTIEIFLNFMVKERVIPTLRSFGLIFFFLQIYIKCILLLLNLIELMPFDLLIDSMSSHPLDFGWTCHFDDNNGAGGSRLPALIPREPAENLERINPYEIYQRIQVLEARNYYNIPPQNNQGDYERLVRENLSRAWPSTGDFYQNVFRHEYFELRVLEMKGILQDKLTNLMLNEPNIGRIMELSPYSDVRKEAYHFIQDRYPPIFLNSFDLPPSRFIINDCLNCLRSLTTDLTVDHNFYKDFYKHFTDQEFRRSIGLPLP